MRGRRAAVLVAAAVVSSACALPTPGGVHAVGDESAEHRQSSRLLVIPPGPVRGATPTQTVLRFLGAQASSDGRHAVARRFLTGARAAAWRDDAEVQVYDPTRVQLRQRTAGSAAVVQVVSRVTGVLRRDGSYQAREEATVAEDYRLVRVSGEWRIDGAPDGLRLSPADLRRSFVAHSVYYLAPHGSEGRRLVPDLLLLPADDDLARVLVARLLQPPSQALAGSVSTAVPRGTRLLGVTSSSGGVLSVNLDSPTRPTGTAAQDLSAQLVWTLRSVGASFKGLRLMVRGRDLEVPGESGVQDAGEWDAYDPQGLAPNAPYFFTSGRRLRASVELPPSPATAGEVGDGRAVPVDAVAVTPDRTQVALLDRSTPTTLVRIGPLRGTSFPVVARGDRLSSPSWGSGDQGLWLLRGNREVVRAVAGGLEPVTVLGLGAGRIDALSVSRDGVRVALVVAGRLAVGRVELVGGRPRVVGLAVVLPGLREVTSVAWASSAELVVLGSLTGPRQVLRVPVDGSSSQVLSTAGLRPTALTASPAGIVLVAGGRLAESSDGGAFRPVRREAAAAPAYPG